MKTSSNKNSLKLHSLYCIVVVAFLFHRFTISADSLAPRGVPLSRASLYDPQKDFSCLDGSKLIPFSFVNDDYCDCPDGTDEPGTSACSRGSFFCLNAGHVSFSISSSRVNDGICDCCDGSDEFSSDANCLNTCDELGRAAREENERLAKLAREGYQKRIEMSQQGKQIKQDKDIERAKLEAERVTAEALRDDKQKIKEQMEGPEKEALERHRAAQEELKRQEEEAEKLKSENEAADIFTLLDSNNDGKLTMDEIKVRQTFDRNKDGQVSDEEALFFLDMQEEMTKEEFFSTGWNIAKPFFLMEQGMFTPPEPAEEERREEDEEMENFEKLHEDDEAQEGDRNIDESSTEHEEHEEDAGLEEPEEEPASSTPAPELEYDEETQRLIDQARIARTEFLEANSKVEEVVNQLQELNEVLNLDFGDDERFAPLLGQCYDLQDREYIYTLCPFKRATQRGRGGGGEVSLGRWGSWSTPYTMMLYDHGQSCWNGPNRSVKVTLKCGLENELISASEPSRCEYAFEFLTPAACEKPEAIVTHDEL